MPALATFLSGKPSSFLDPSKAFDELTTYERQDGLSAAELMDSLQKGGLTYDDFLMLPGKIDFAAQDVVVESRITRNVVLKTPFMSSPMDTVTEAEMAISLAVSIKAELLDPEMGIRGSNNTTFLVHRDSFADSIVSLSLAPGRDWCHSP